MQFTWRTLAREGKLVLPEPGDAVEFAAMVVETPAPEPPSVKPVCRTEIVVCPVTIRLEEGASAARPGIKDGLMTLSHAQFEALFAGLGGGFGLSKREHRSPSNSCDTMTQHDRFRK